MNDIQPERSQMFDPQHEPREAENNEEEKRDSTPNSSKLYTPAFNELPSQISDTRGLFTIQEEAAPAEKLTSSQGAQVGQKKYHSIRQKLKNELRDITI